MEKLESALKIFEGTHDFGSFKKKGSETKNDVRTIRKIHLKHYGKIHAITIESNGFLRAQIRLMMGAAFASVGQNHDQVILRNQLELHEKFYTETAPANGLYLAKIIY
jgi:tRNA pseudouridine38-40 synthase